jgi:hypothetical protein
MRDELEKKIYDDFSALYANYTSPNCDGIECGDGWFDIVYRLSFDIAKIIATSENINPKDYTMSCVKEKYGTLRFYMCRYPEGSHERIAEAIKDSERTCEDCGKEGRMKTDGWMRTICDPCDAERQRRREQMFARLRRNDSELMDVDW